ncbi:olfactory receptor 5AR1-like [Engystomops pustulosus]|uniref:olfactory receptor 5AR1-like n=1 Tax=Engystomops pustulosus TaxID=76066 RepID=UPI003AFAF423
MNDCDISAVTEFSLSPFSTSRMNEILIFWGFSVMYLLAVVGNMIIVVLVCSAPQLHTPMYFFLCNLSSVDIVYVSAILPKMLSIILTEDKTISFYGCMTQLCFFLFCGDSDIFILTFMAYDRYVAVCSPLHYTLIMTRRVCWILVTSYVILSVANSVMFTKMTSTLSFCYSRLINHFFCEIIPLLLLSSSDTENMNMIITVEDFCLPVLSLVIILISYTRIIYTIFKMRSSRGQMKAFSSCSSHIITVLLFYGPSIYMYMKPESKHSKEQDKILSMFYVAVVPMLNPFVYSLRNKEVLGAARKTVNYIWYRVAVIYDK